MKAELSATPWTVRTYRAGDEYQLTKLFETVFARPVTVEHWLWKLCGLATPIDNMWLAVAGERVIGHYGGIPLRFWLDGQECLVMYPADAMVDPEFRRCGVLTAMVTRAHAVWREAGALFVPALLNEQWQSRKEALQWQKLFPLKWKIRPINPEHLLARRLHLPILRWARPLRWLWRACFDARLTADPSVETRVITRAGAEFDDLWQSMRSHIRIGVIRDRRWVHWRHLSSPQKPQLLLAERHGKPAGYVVYRTSTTHNSIPGFITEICFDPADESTRDTLIAAALERLRAAGADFAATLAIPGLPLERRLHRAGFMFSWGAFDLWVVTLSPALRLEDLQHPEDWFMSGADYDVI